MEFELPPLKSFTIEFVTTSGNIVTKTIEAPYVTSAYEYAIDMYGAEPKDAYKRAELIEKYIELNNL